MLSSQLKIKIKTSLFLALLFATSSPVYAGLDVDMVANIKNSTCKSGLSNLGNIDLGVVGVDYFSGNVGIGDTSPAAMLTVGSGDLFQVSSGGAVTAAP